MTAAPLVLDRRLAIQLLHAAQVAAPAGIEGAVIGLLGEPQRYQSQVPEAAPVWARVFSNPKAPAVPTAQQLGSHPLVLMISLDTKGVLALRAWVQQNGAPCERAVAIRD
jgi:hypothetical protein